MPLHCLTWILYGEIYIINHQKSGKCRTGGTKNKLMKQLKHIIATAAFSFLLNISFAQNLNWKNLQSSQKHIIYLNLGFDNASSMGIGYGYHLNTKMPVVLNLEYSMPFGDKVFDDLKTKIGGQVNLVRASSFFATVKAYGVIRRFENDFARMINFGSEFSTTMGIYKNKWFATTEFGFDKAIITHVKHSSLMKQYNPEVQTGWYIPTGGNFIYGLQSGYSFKSNDLYAKVGRTVSQDLKTTPMLPYYFQLGWNVRL